MHKLLKSVGSIAIIGLFILTSCKKNENPVVMTTLEEGLEGYWKLDEPSGNALDMTGLHSGDPYLVNQGIPGKIGSCYEFIGAQKSYVNCGNIPLSTYSLSFWAQRASAYRGECMIGFGGMHTGLWIFADNRLTLGDNNADALAKWSIWTDRLSYHHIVLIATAGETSGEVELYIDGISQGTQACNVPEMSNLVLGSDYSNGSFNSQYIFAGKIDEVGLWNRSLTDDEVTELFKKGVGITYPFNLEVEMPDLLFYTLPHGKLLHSSKDKRVILEIINSKPYLKFSSDNGLSFNAGIDVSSKVINKARILSNGNIVLFGYNKIYYSNDNLNSIHDCIIQDRNGGSFKFHYPLNPDYPGAYFEFMGGFVESDGIMVLGNYTNSEGGASPVILWYSLDGITWKEFYTFGQIPEYSDNGTTGGGLGGTLLGDPNNTLTARHVHAVNVGYDGNFYACTGDANRSMHFLRCTYDKTNDKWRVEDLLTYASSSWQRMRALGVYERNGYIYWGSDGPGTFIYDGNTYDCFGIYKCATSDLNDPTKHILLQPLTDPCYSFLNSRNIVFAGFQNQQSVAISMDYGETWSSFSKPSWMTGNVLGVWYNDLHKFFVTSTGVIIYHSIL